MSPKSDDEIVSEIRRIRDEHAKKFDYDLKRIFEDFKRREQESGRKFVRLQPRAPTTGGKRTA